MRLIGLTGGIGSGKSTVGRMLVEHGLREDEQAVGLEFHDAEEASMFKRDAAVGTSRSQSLATAQPPRLLKMRWR